MTTDDDEALLHECPECGGTGALVATPDRFSRYYERCPLCGGSGVIPATPYEEET